MFEVSAELEFCAAHFHPDYDGKCRQVHGHNYKVIVTVRSKELDELGMVCDFYLVKKETRALLEEFDHKLINEHEDFKDRSPSSEHLAKYFFDRLQPKFDVNHHWLHSIAVWETDRTAAKYIRPEDVA